MGIRHVLLATAAVALLLTACASGQGPGSGQDSGSGSIASAIPPAEGEVLGQGTVLQVGEAPPELCLGSVAESYPPQCGGPEIRGWEWSTVDQWEEASGVIWGSYAVQGEWDGESFTVTRPPIPLSLYDAMPVEDPRMDPATPGVGGEAELLRVQQQITSDSAGILGSGPMNGYLFVTVVYDDGSLQQAFDERFGADIVAVQSALRLVE